MQPIVVLHRVNWKDRAAAPCTMEDEYSIDEGDTWMSRAQFHNWHNNLIEIIDAYPSARVCEDD